MLNKKRFAAMRARSMRKLWALLSLREKEHSAERENRGTKRD
jgi:hypothetical protein